MQGIDGEALDRWITGNYGEDQYKDGEICDDCPCLVDDPKCHLMVCKKNKRPEECAADAKDAALEAAAEQQRDMRAAYGDE